MTAAKQPVTPKPGQVWQSNHNRRQVRIEDTDHRWAHARRTETGDVERIDLYAFNRSWTHIGEEP